MSNIVHYYVVLGFLDLTLVALYGVLSRFSMWHIPIHLFGFALATLPFIAIAALIVTWPPIRYVWLKRVVASTVYAGLAYVGLTWATQIIDRVTNHHGLYDLPISLVVLAGLIAGLAVKSTTQEPRKYRATSPPVV